MYTIEQYREGARTLSNLLNGFEPEVLLILGSGLGGLAESIPSPRYAPYGDIPHCRVSTVSDHVGRFVAGELGGKRVLLMQGRLHLYEGYTAEEAAYPIRLARMLGAHSMIVTNAAGGVNTELQVGQLVALSDVMAFGLRSPLYGPNLESFGVRFPDMSAVFDPRYRALFKEAARDGVAEGVYFYMPGPQFETPAEIRAIRALGGDVVGMSTVPECIAARHCGMRILGITLVTNMAAGVLPQPLSGEEVTAAANAASGRFRAAITAFLERM